MRRLGILLAFAVSSASAGDAAPVFEPLPVGDVRTDGFSPVEVHVVAVRADGTGIDDLEVKLTGRGFRTLDGWASVGGGVYRFVATPEIVGSPGTVTARVKGRSSDKAHKIDLQVPLPVVPPLPPGLLVQVSPSALVVGQAQEATLSILTTGGVPLDVASLRVRTSLGEVSDVVDMGGGRYLSQLRIDDRADPGLALVTLSDGGFPERRYGGVIVPVSVRRDVTVAAEAGDTIMLRVDGREFGPVEATAKGAVVPGVLVPPGVSSATVVRVRDGQPVESELPLDVAVSRRVQIVPPPASIPQDPGVEIPIRVLVATPSGGQDDAATLRLKTDIGVVSDIVYEGDGVYMGVLRPGRGVQGRPATLEAWVDGELEMLDQTEISAISIRPARLDLRAQPERLSGAGEIALIADVFDTGGEQLGTAGVAWNLVGARAEGPPEKTLAGSWLQRARSLGGPVEVHGTAVTPGSANAARDVVVVPTRSWLPADGISSARLLVIGLDAAGYPVANARLSVRVDSGDGSVPSEVLTDEFGIGEVFYTAGRVPGLVRIRARAGGVSGVAVLGQGMPALKQVVFPVSGTEQMRARVRAWLQVASGLRVEAD